MTGEIGLTLVGGVDIPRPGDDDLLMYTSVQNRPKNGRPGGIVGPRSRRCSPDE